MFPDIIEIHNQSAEGQIVCEDVKPHGGECGQRGEERIPNELPKPNTQSDDLNYLSWSDPATACQCGIPESANFKLTSSDAWHQSFQSL